MRQKIDRKRMFKLIALGWDAKRIMDEVGISRRTYFRVRNEFLRLSEEERGRILEEAKREYEESIFDKKAWFDVKTCRSQIPIIQRWFDVMRVRDVSLTEAKERIAFLRKICLGYVGKGENQIRVINWKIHPQDFTEEHGIRFISALKNLGINDYNYRKVIRNFLIFGKGVIPTYISGKKQGYGKMAQEYLTVSEVERIFEFVDKLPERERMPLKTLLMFLFHSGTRIKATLRITEDDLIWHGSEVWQVHVVDKGREGKKEKTKVLTLPLRKALTEYVEWRRKHGINHKRLFRFRYNHVKHDYEWLLDRMREIYSVVLPHRRIVQTFHIWRHSFAMYYLRKTGWNYDLVALLGGWDDTKILKDCYGKPETKDIIAFLEKIEKNEGEVIGTKL